MAQAVTGASSRRLVAPLVAVLCLWAADGRAADQESTIKENVALFAAGAGFTAAAGLTFGIAEVLYAVDGSWMPTGWAIAEMAAGSTLTLAGGTLWALIPLRGSARALYIVPFGLSAWFLTHGVLSLALQRGPGRAAGRGLAGRWWAGFVPLPSGGGVATIGGGF